MTTGSHAYLSTSPEQTAAFARALAPLLGHGDVILLIGDVGAGKTHFARALIQSRLEHPEDVPSPTFTLVQTYPAGDCDIWHMDLYRITSTQEIEELGLTNAMETEICLIEWPDRLGPLSPKHALTLHFSPSTSDDARRIMASWDDPRWDGKLVGWSH